MNIGSLSATYRVRRLEDADISEIFTLCEGNPFYYQYCPPPVTVESIKKDMLALPPGKTMADKYFLGYFSDGLLIAVMDLIAGYPDAETAFIGFFMMAQPMQGKNFGTEIITEACHALKGEGFSEVRLGYAKGNGQSEAFWLKNHFEKTGAENQAENYVSVYMRRPL
jgi:RimJ/RimL family protein N-acetyltransferase